MGEVDGDDNAAILIEDLNTEYILPLSPIPHSIRRLWTFLASMMIRLVAKLYVFFESYQTV